MPYKEVARSNNDVDALAVAGIATLIIAALATFSSANIYWRYNRSPARLGRGDRRGSSLIDYFWASGRVIVPEPGLEVMTAAIRELVVRRFLPRRHPIHGLSSATWRRQRALGGRALRPSTAQRFVLPSGASWGSLYLRILGPGRSVAYTTV